ncbi:uncharacterized protein LOC119427178 [Nematolebias whitei]|uniref:uncharacterized protein LOC119427178 n=1 Tax=Nematolebias whitei TaxID=451745 RepID=UPI00189721FD|nr:uncharacterized protein LOC119427178 [Nematolebias whitei]
MRFVGEWQYRNQENLSSVKWSKVILEAQEAFIVVGDEAQDGGAINVLEDDVRAVLGGGSAGATMAAVGAEVTGSSFLSSGLVGFFIVLLLFIFFTALCSMCNRQSFKLQEPRVDPTPSTLIRVVKLEEVKENPMIEEIQKDEKEFCPKEDSAVTSSSSQHKEPETIRDSSPAEEVSVSFPPWRSHLMAPQSKDVNGLSPSDSSHVYDIIQRGRGNSSDALTRPDHPPTQLHGSTDEENIPQPALSTNHKNSVYAQVSKKN